ncbi:MAG: translation initiation factor IF-2 [Clostridia bacterium]|nr:translation initiation factor IF-2 [Clostridia bacterium]
MLKYKIHEFAKDLNLKSNKLIDLLAQFSEAARKSQTSLTAEELDYAFDALTDEYAVDSFDAYFARVKPVEEVKEPAAAPAPEEAPAAPEAPAPAEAPAKAEPAAKKQGEAKPEARKDAQRPAAQPAKKPAGRPDGRPAAPGQRPAGPAPFKKKEKDNKNDASIQARTKGERKTVNTRTEEVELDKYNERYENMSSYSVRDRDGNANKQKIKQKSQQYNKKGAAKAKKRETEAERLKRIAAERASRKLVIKVGDEITVGELASMMKMTAAEVIKKLFSYGIMAGINETIDFDTAALVAEELGVKVEKEVVVTIEDRIIDATEDTEETLEARSPVVVVMGHVDHGKTSILDAIRHTSVTSTESGGITQHIGAYRVALPGGDITFLDTPGHAAFTEMRARGAKATDIAVLVVAADDGIMPQTIEAINHAKAAEVSIIVAINKMDKPGANPDRIMQQLTDYELVPEEWGGDTICVPVSAKTGLNIDKLLESILLVAEMKELKANPNRAAKGVVIEARLDKGKGPVATLLVQNGTLKNGDIVVAGTAVGRIRVMTDYKGKKVKDAGPSVPVEVMGLDEVPMAGDAFDAVTDEKLARALVEQRKQKLKDEQFNAFKKVTLDTLFSTIEAGELKDLNIIVKADVQGSVEALKQNLEKLSNDEVRVRVIHGGVGAIVESDVMLANASNAIIIGFHVRPDATAQAHAERDHVEMRMYSVIYDCIEDVQAAIKGMLAPKFRDVELGKAEIRRVFRLSSAGTIAGSYILKGKVTRNAKVRVVRDGIVIAEDVIASLKREKDDAREVMEGYECGIGLDKYNDIKEGDILEAYLTEEVKD